MQYGRHEETLTLPAWQLDAGGRLPVHRLVPLLMQAADRHSLALGFDVATLMARGQTWVLAHLRLQVTARPSGRDGLALATWPSGMRGRYVGREFLLADRSGPLVRADSEWLLLDLASGRPVRPEAHFPPERIACREKVFDVAFPALAKPAHPEPVGDFPVRWEDIDANGHVANPHYAAWILECLPGLVSGERELLDLFIEFRLGAVHGDTVRLLREAAGAEIFRFSLVRAADAAELVRASARVRALAGC